MHATVKAARIAGALVVSGDATATAAKIPAHETTFKLAILSDLFAGVASVCLVLALYRMFADVDRFQAAAMVIFGGLTIAPIVAPDYGDAIFTYGQPAFFAEIAIMLFLLTKGANVAQIPVTARRR